MATLCLKHDFESNLNQKMSELNNIEIEITSTLEQKSNLENEKLEKAKIIDSEFKSLLNDLKTQENNLNSKENQIKSQINSIMSNNSFHWCKTCQMSLYLHELTNWEDIVKTVLSKNKFHDIKNYFDSNNIKFSCGTRIDPKLLRCEFCKDYRNYSGCGSNGSDDNMFCIGLSSNFELIKTHRHVYLICPQHKSKLKEFKEITNELKEIEEGYKAIHQEEKNMIEESNLEQNNKLGLLDFIFKKLNKDKDDKEGKIEELNKKIEIEKINLEKIEKKSKETNIDLYDKANGVCTEIIEMMKNYKINENIGNNINELMIKLKSGL